MEQNIVLSPEPLAPVQPAPQSTQTLESKNPLSRWLLIFTGLVLLAILFSGVYFLGIYQGMNQKPTSKTPIAQAVAKTTPTPTLIPLATTSETLTATDTAGWKTYTSSSEGLSFKYPQEWTLDDVPCVNAATQQKAECVQLHSPKDKNGVPMTVYYQYNDPGQDYAGGLKVEEIQSLNVTNSKKPLFLIIASDQGDQTSQIILYDKQVSLGDTISNLAITSQTNNSVLIKMIAYLQTGVQNSLPYTLTELKSHPYYNDAIAIFKSLSY